MFYGCWDSHRYALPWLLHGTMFLLFIAMLRYQRTSADIHRSVLGDIHGHAGISRVAVDSHGYVRLCRHAWGIDGCGDMRGSAWNTHGLWLWMTMDAHGYPRISTGVHGCPWMSMDVCGCPSTPTGYIQKYGHQ